MKIGCRDIRDSADLFHVYNEQITTVPYCWPVSEEEFGSGLKYRVDEDKPNEGLRSEKIIIGEQAGKMVGFAHVAIGEIIHPPWNERGGFIRFLTYRAGHRAIGHAILAEAGKYLCGLGAKRILAFRYQSGYQFYRLGFGMLSDRLGHIYGLLCRNGYEADGGEIYMAQPDYNVAKPSPPDRRIEIDVKWEPGRGDLPGLTVKALRNGGEIGSCRTVSAGQYCKAQEAQDTCFTNALGVKEQEQGKGWGRYLLQRSLWEMRKIGYKNAVISTNWKNFRALLFYANYGYRVTDTAYALAKNIPQA